MMNMGNEWLLPHSNDLRQDFFAIREFCAARMEEEEGQELEEEEEQEYWHEEEIWSSQLASIEVDKLVDTFFNKDANKEENETFLDHEQHHQDPSTVSVMNDDNMNMNVSSPRMMIQGVDEGLELVHLLLACAEAVGCRDARLAHSVLTKIWPCVTPCGDSLQRVSHCFAMALQSRLSLLLHSHDSNGSSSCRAITREEKGEAFALLHRATPYIAFGFVAANEAICRAARGKDMLHIIDLGMEHNLQWPSVIEALSSRPEGPPKSVRITGFIADQDPTELEMSLIKLCNEASAFGICLEYHLVREQVSPSTLTRGKLGLRDGEALFVNSVMHLHKHAKENRVLILKSIKKINPSLVTVVEQDANHNGPFFLGRFLESLHYYSAIFDSLDATLPRDSHERMKIERFHLAEEICNVVACEGGDRVERHERADQWRRQLGRAGFRAVGFEYLDQAKILEMVCGYGCDGYTVGSDKGCLQLGWKGRPIMLASTWHLNNLHHSSS